MYNFLIGTCIFVFAATSLITLLGITKKIKIDKKYLDQLFKALILQIVAIGILGFSQFMKNQGDAEFIRITGPNKDFNLNGSSKLYIYGVALLKNNQSISCNVIIENDTTYLTNIQTDSRDIFSKSITIDPSILPNKVKLEAFIKEGDKIIIQDDPVYFDLGK